MSKKKESFNSSNISLPFTIQFAQYIPLPTSIPFPTPFKTNPIVVGNGVTIQFGNPFYSMSIDTVSPTSFLPGVDPNWPVMGINYIALESLGNDYSTSPYIFDFQTISFPSQIVDGQGLIMFTKTFPEIPTVVCTINGTDDKHDLGVFNITTTSFQIYSSNGWPRDGINYLAVSHNTSWTGDIKSLPFQIQFGTINNPSPTEWIGGYIFPTPFQSIPVVVGTSSFLNTPSGNCSVTFDTISCNMVHINVSGGWPSNGIQYIGICKYVKPTSSDSPILMDGNLVPYNGHTMTIPVTTLINNPMSILTSSISLQITEGLFGDYSPYVDVNNIFNNSFEMDICNAAQSRMHGLSFISFAKNLASNISQLDLPYIIDFGSFNRDFPNPMGPNGDGYRDINIPFNFTFPTIPTVIFPFNNYTFMNGQNISTIQITSVSVNYFTIEWLSSSSTLPTIPNSTFFWMAILENPQSSVKSSPFYPIDFGSYSTDPSTFPYTLRKVNGKDNSKVYNMITYKTKFSKQPVVISGNQLCEIDTITKNYFHFSLSNFATGYISWIAVEFPSTIDSSLFVCPSTILPVLCPATYVTPSSSAICTTTGDNLPTMIDNTFPEIAVDIPAGSNPPSPALHLQDIVYCNVGVDKGTTHPSTSNAICKITYFKLNSDGGTLNIDVNTDLGWFSKCSSFGNVFIRITTSYASDDQLIFNFRNIGMNENFQYYVQWGYADDMVYGPFTTTFSGTFGHADCNPFNVWCKIEHWLEDECAKIVGPLVSVAVTKTGFNTAACAGIISAFGGSCVAEAAQGGIDPVGDAYCAGQTSWKAAICSTLAGVGEGYAVSELCKL